MLIMMHDDDTLYILADEFIGYFVIYAMYEVASPEIGSSNNLANQLEQWMNRFLSAFDYKVNEFDALINNK